MIRRGMALLLCASPLLAQQRADVAHAEGLEAIGERIARIAKSASPAEVEKTVRELCAFGTRHVLSRTDSASEGTGAARSYMKQRFEQLIEKSGGRLRVELQRGVVPVARDGMPKEVEVVNVIATLPGTSDSARVYVIGGHYDSRNSDGADGKRAAPGANDDASGTAVALEACRLLCAETFPATIVFCAFDGEEQGLIGSKLCAERFVASGSQIDGMIGCDIVGNTLGMDGVRRTDAVRCFSYAQDGNDSPGRSLARALTHAASAHSLQPKVQLVFRGDRFGRGGDHRSFHEAGAPAVRLTEMREDYSRQHQDLVERDGKPYGDLPEFVDFDYAAGVARVCAATLCELAAAPRPPLVRAASASRTAYDTELMFELPESAADCEFVFRATTAPDWEGAMASKDAEMRIDDNGRRRALLRSLALDELVVGVRSIGVDGAKSRVATPPDPDRMTRRTR